VRSLSLLLHATVSISRRQKPSGDDSTQWQGTSKLPLPLVLPPLL